MGEGLGCQVTLTRLEIIGALPPSPVSPEWRSEKEPCNGSGRFPVGFLALTFEFELSTLYVLVFHKQLNQTKIAAMCMNNLIISKTSMVDTN